MIIKINDNEGRKIDLCIKEFNIQNIKYSSIFVLENSNEYDTYLMKKLKRQITEHNKTQEFDNVDNLQHFKKSIIKDFNFLFGI